MTHGILAETLLAGDHMGELGETYRRILSALQKAMRPVDTYEQLLVEKLAFLYVRLIRVYRADWQLAPKLFEKLEESVGAEYNPFIRKGLIDFEGEVIGHRKDPTPELLVRYESNTERQISRTIDQFERWRMMRPNNSEPPAELQEQIETPEVKDAAQSDK